MTIRDCLLSAACLLSAIGLQPTLRGETYDWLNWSYSADQTASAYSDEIGEIGLAVSGDGLLALLPMRLQFDGATFTPVEAQAVGAGQNTQGEWRTTLDFSKTVVTGGLIVGLGNFGHGHPQYPGYQLKAFDRAGEAIPLSGITQVGSFGHTWTSGQIWQPFNDDVSLNADTGALEVTPVAGSDDHNSDILLLSLPPGIGRLEIASIGVSGGDSINILVGLPHLNVMSSGSNALVSWAAPGVNLQLEATPNLQAGTWDVVSDQPVLADGIASLTLPSIDTARFFRLHFR